MPRQTFIINRFDGGINSKDSYVLDLVSNNNRKANDESSIQIAPQKTGEKIVQTGNINRSISQNQQDLKDNFLVKADNIMVDSIGKFRVIGSFIQNLTKAGVEISAGYGLYFFRSDYRSGSFLSAGANDSSRYLVLADKNGSIYIYDYDTGETWRNPFNLGTITGAKPVMFYSDGALRVVDSSFNSGAIPKWFGYIKRNHFNSIYTYNKWYAKNNNLNKPTVLSAGTFSSISAGAGFHISITETPGGSWEEGTYEVACSFVYDNNQESLLKIPTSNNTFSVTNYYKLKFTVYAQAEFNERISGARIYARKNNSDDDWFLIVDIDLNEGVRAKIGSGYSAWTNIADLTYSAITNYTDSPQLDTYETLNGYSQKEESNSIGSSGMGYKWACVANRRVFIFAPKYKDNNGNIKYYGDRIVYSEANKLDTFLANNYIDLGINDGDEFICGHVFANKIYAFKRDKLYIIDISGALDVEWNLIAEFNNLGVENHNAAVKTDFGIAWVNSNGCYFHDGQQKHDLTENIDDEEWGVDFVTDNVQIAYLPDKNQLLIFKDNNSDTLHDSDLYIYDFRTKSFIVGLNAFGTSGPISNFILDENYKLLTFYSGDDYVYKWRDNIDNNYSSFEMITKEFDFGDKSRVKKVFAFYFNYALDGGDITNPFSYSLDAGVTWITPIATFTDNSYQLTNQKIIPSSTIKCNTIMIKLKSTVVRKFELQSIEVDFRPLSNRKVSLD